MRCAYHHIISVLTSPEDAPVPTSEFFHPYWLLERCNKVGKTRGGKWFLLPVHQVILFNLTCSMHATTANFNLRKWRRQVDIMICVFGHAALPQPVSPEEPRLCPRGLRGRILKRMAKEMVTTTAPNPPPQSPFLWTKVPNKNVEWFYLLRMFI